MVEDFDESRQMLTKITVEAALNAERDGHFGFDKHEQADSDKNRNGAIKQTFGRLRLKLVITRKYLQTPLAYAGF